MRLRLTWSWGPILWAKGHRILIEGASWKVSITYNITFQGSVLRKLFHDLVRYFSYILWNRQGDICLFHPSENQDFKNIFKFLIYEVVFKRTFLLVMYDSPLLPIPTSNNGLLVLQFDRHVMLSLLLIETFPSSIVRLNFYYVLAIQICVYI